MASKHAEQEERDVQHSWEVGYDRTWDIVQEDEHGNLLTADKQRERSRRQNAHRITQSIRRGLIRYVLLALDMSASMKQTDMPPSRAAVAKTTLQHFVRGFFDQNPICQLGLLVSHDKRVEQITELSGNPKSHVNALENLNDFSGLASLQEIVDKACKCLRHIPDYGQRELIIVYGSISTCDPGDIFESIEKAKQHKIRISVVSLAAELYIARKMTEETQGTFGVVLDVQHFRELISAQTQPPPALRSQGPQYTDFVQMGFPRRKLDTTPSFTYDAREVVLSSTAYSCPRCTTRAAELPTQCAVCGLQLNSSAHIARSYHHLFPVPNFAEVIGIAGQCYACVKRFDAEGNLLLQCPKCSNIFCVDCDMFIHNHLQNCPGCV